VETIIKQLQIENKIVQNHHTPEESITRFFSGSGCQFIKKDKNTLVFGHPNSSLFDNWRFNPLKRYFKAVVTLHETMISVVFTINKSGQVDSIAENAFWDSFAQNFSSYISTNTDFKKPLETSIHRVRRKNLFFLGYIILFALLGGITAFFLHQFTGWKSVSYLIIPFMVVFFIKFREIIAFRKGYLPDDQTQ